MGRSRGVSRSAVEDPSQRSSKRKKTTSNVQNVETSPATVCQETIEGKNALYHCNYCHKDISGMIRIKCALCPDFDLCIECFSVGAEVTPHKSNHPYRVMDNLSFPLNCSDWNADEEILLLEGIEMYGFGNWNEVAEHVGTKSRSQCIDHYNAVYMNSPCFPLPDMSHVMGKSREELLAMAKGNDVIKKELRAVEELTLKEESCNSSRLQIESQKGDLAHQSSTISNSVKKASNVAQNKDSINVEETQADRSIGEKKPRISGEEGPSVTELSGYNFKREEFEIEYDNDAEQLLADMEFKETDTDAERELKLQVLHIYSKKLDERKRRKKFILERNLLYPNLFEKNLSPEEREIYNRFKVFMRFHSKEEHEGLMRSIIEEHHIVKRIQGLQEARAAGCRTAAQANQFIEQKRKKEAEECAQKVKENVPVGSSGKVLLRPNSLKGEVDGSPRGVAKSPTGFNLVGRDLFPTVAKQAISSSLDDWDITGFIGADLLTESEKNLCWEMRILPSHYLSMLLKMSEEITKGTVTNKSDAHSLFKVEPSKVDKVYDMLMKKGIAQA